jgi:hypothetical protein
MITNEFDTLEFTKRAQQHGFTGDQSEFLAEQTLILLNQILVARFVLKEELVNFESRMRSFHYEMSSWILGSIAAIMTICEVFFHLIWR